MAKPAAMNLNQQNQFARDVIKARGVIMTQQIASLSVTPSSQNVINIVPQNVGLALGFIVEVNGTLANTGGSQASRTEFGAANALSNITFNDLQNNVRINAPGWLLAMVATAKQGFVFGGAYTVTSPYNFGANWTVQSLASTIAATTGTAALRQIYWAPLAYSQDDLRGAIYLGVVQATCNLALTINTTPGYTTGDPTLAIAGGASTAVAWSGAVTVTVYQVFIDQIPMGSNKQPILPPIDISTQYLIIGTSGGTGMSVGQDYAILYPNLRTFLCTYALFDNGGTLGVGADINYWSLSSANQTNIFKVTPQIAALNMRTEIMSDPPKGLYIFSHRRKPINTIQWGNMALNLNASTVNSGAQLLMGYEMFALTNSQTLAGSLPTH